MIKFLRRIRKRLLKKRLLKKYLVYAIGEIVLVVVGILIALQINSWNGKLQERKEEQKVLINLRTELKSNLAFLKYIKKNKEGALLSMKVLMNECTNNSNYKTHNLDSLLGTAFISGWKFVSHTGVLTNVLESDKLNLIQNDSLKHLLVYLPTAIGFVAMEDDSYRSDMHNYYLPFLGKYYQTKNMTNALNQLEIDWTSESSRFTRNPEDLLNNPEFESILNSQLIFMKFSLFSIQYLEQAFETILPILEQEIKDKKHIPQFHSNEPALPFN
ncbi:hypothetical protein KFZ70_05690 [Tamlana fucoidanivorans]|uniref:Uncharacterized protein n=1 Tax=Allotamlana fucoidanivorans TaxID=2583814 RepID=A0A5C4SRH2_9FLAO|nr:DUF6090 family protein [Tamlana fucoidanivorans]TNJ47000.1 hypothetical protein FGF67_00290 [Tamlana fucoidanivorans]